MNDESERSLMRDAERCGGVSSGLVVQDSAAAGIRERRRQNGAFACPEPKRGDGCRNWTRVDGRKPRRLSERLSAQVSGAALLNFMDGRGGNDDRGAEMLQNLKESGFGQQNDRRRVDDPE